MTDLIIFPYNSNGLEAVECIDGEYNLIGFVDDVIEKHGVSYTGHPVWGREAFDKYKQAKVLAMPGGPTSFVNKPVQISSLNIEYGRFARIIHPSVAISKYVTLGTNILIMAGAVITSNARIGNHVCILPNTVIHHEVIIEDYCWIGANVVVAGKVKICRNAFVGSASSIINNIEIGENALIGMGSNVIRSIVANDRVAGNPARSL